MKIKEKSKSSSDSSHVHKKDDHKSTKSSQPSTQKKPPSHSKDSFRPARKKLTDISGGGSGGGADRLGNSTPKIQRASQVGAAQGTGATRPRTVGYHASPDALTQQDPAAQREKIMAEIDAAASHGARSMTVVTNQNTDPAVFRDALVQADKNGIQLNVRVNCGEWKPTIPAKWDAASHTYQYDPAAAEGYKKTMDKLLGTNFAGDPPEVAAQRRLTEEQLKGLGSVQLGNEPLDPKEWDNFIGKSWDGVPENDNDEYKRLLDEEAPAAGMDRNGLSQRIARSMGLATRDMMQDMGPELANALGDTSRIATPAMGAGFADYNNFAAQREYFLGLTGMGLDNKVSGPSGLEFAGQVGVHAYLDSTASPEQLKEFVATTGYGEALRVYEVTQGVPAPGSATARPVFTEVGLDNRFEGGQGKQLTDVFVGQFVNEWNNNHPGAPVADVSIWGAFPGYDFEPQWAVKPETVDDLANSVRENNPG